MDRLFELGGAWLAMAHAFYGLVFLVLPVTLFAYVPLLAAVVWAVRSGARLRR